MKKTLSAILTVSALAALALLPAHAVPPGMKIEYKGGGAGKVIFDGRQHRIRGNSCINCHPDIFVMKGRNNITMAAIYENRFCGACHNGVDSFDAKKKENCNKCHKK